MPRIVALDQVELPCPSPSVFWVLLEVGSYSRWWPEPFRFRVLGPLPAQPGTRLAAQYGPLIRWVAEISEIEPGKRLGLCYRGAWEGRTAWELEAPSPECCLLSYRIDIEPGPLWLRTLQRFAPFDRLHSREMERVFARLRSYLAERESGKLRGAIR
ncbi:MAG TPA: SRPBCC family protein [Meiothermus sp.]|jgi:hypothetical protein|nr:SRPBCC family protein [Meiothermus sp.]